MALNKPIVAPEPGIQPMASLYHLWLASWQGLKAWLSLTKPGITLTSVLSALMGFQLARLGGAQSPLSSGWLLFAGMGLSVAGACTLNMWLERHVDARMKRTLQRALPAGRVSPRAALAFGLLLGASGIGVMLWATPLLSTTLAALAFACYVGLYTPLKQRSPHAYLVGVLPGALPTLVGWSAATGQLHPTAWLLFAILAFWQIAHALALALLLETDYENAGILTFCRAFGPQLTRRIIQLSTILLVLALWTLLFAVPRGLWLSPVLLPLGLWLGLLACHRHEATWARKIFLASLVALLALLVSTLTLTLF